MESKITFSVSGTVTQGIRIIKEGLTVEDIVNGLNEGEFITTTWWSEDGERGTINDMENGVAVAELTYQEIDGEYLDFEGDD